MQREPAIFEEQLIGTQKEAVEKLRQHLLYWCRRKGIPSMSGFIYSTDNPISINVHIITSKYTGDFQTAVDGKSLPLNVTLNVSRGGVVTYVEDPRTV